MNFHEISMFSTADYYFTNKYSTINVDKANKYDSCCKLLSLLESKSQN